MMQGGNEVKAHWFQLWLQGGCCWARVTATEEYKQEDERTEALEKAWLTHAQLADVYKSSA
eukprot:9741381-Alexandrium_andersonii.AAC.1